MINFLERNKIISLILFILIAIEIFYFSTISFGPSTISQEFDIIPTTYHFTVFFLFAFFLIISLKGKNKIKRSHITLTLILSVIYSVLDEVHQIFVPNRASDIMDILVDSIGIFSSILIYNFIDHKNHQKP